MDISSKAKSKLVGLEFPKFWPDSAAHLRFELKPGMDAVEAEQLGRSIERIAAALQCQFKSDPGDSGGDGGLSLGVDGSANVGSSGQLLR